MGGTFGIVMRSPEGEEFPNVGWYFEIVTNQRLVWTDALLRGYRPSLTPFMTAMLAFESRGEGTRP